MTGRRTGGITRRAILGGAAGLAAVALCGPARAQAAAEAAIRGAIEGQIGAFLREDVGAAFAYASPAIRRLFRSPENFGRMVRQGYPMVWKPGGWRFSTLAPEGEGLRQTVVITDAAGVPHVADYSMVLIDGAWKINGVRLRPAPDAGA